MSFVGRGGFLEFITSFFEFSEVVFEDLLGGGGFTLAVLHLTQVFLLQITDLLLLRFQLLGLLLQSLLQLAYLNLCLLMLCAQLF